MEKLDEGSGPILETTAYLPERIAEVGNVIRYKDDKGVWQRGWRIAHAGHLTDDPPDWRKSIRVHRKNSGDSDPIVK